MKKAILVALASIAVSLVLLERPVQAGEIARKFTNPVHQGYRLDWCAEWGTQCGKSAASAWCHAQGYDRGALGWKMDADIGAKAPTKVFRSGQVCNQSFCDGFAVIDCTRTAAAGEKPRPGERKIVRID